MSVSIHHETSDDVDSIHSERARNDAANSCVEIPLRNPTQCESFFSRSLFDLTISIVPFYLHKYISRKSSMKLFLAILAGCALSSVNAIGLKSMKKKMQLSNFKADSSAARKLISKSSLRRLEDGFDEAFVASNSIRFEGCHQASSWSDDGWVTSNLVRYSLCPTGSCSSSGCAATATGEYVVDLETYLDAYLESKMDEVEYKCEMMRETCGCEGSDDDCLYYCSQNYNFYWSSCVNDDEEDEARWAECQRVEAASEDSEDRRLEGDDAESEDEEEAYVGPICSSNGTAVYMTVFSDEDCAYEKEDGLELYKNITGNELEYTSTSLIDDGCVSCLEPVDEEDQNDDDEEDADEVTRFCEETYDSAAKCEDSTDNTYPDTSGCSYISSLKNSGDGSYASTNAPNAISTSNLGTFAGGMFAIFAVGGLTYLRMKRNNKDEKTVELMEK